jgi:hypothetical protein
MSLVDLFNPSFLMYLGILVLVIAGLIIYFETKLREQNHKITSMFSIVSTLAEDMNQMKFVISHVTNQGGAGPILEENRGPFSMPTEQENLIEVSDDEEDEEEIAESEDNSSELKRALESLKAEFDLLAVNEQDPVHNYLKEDIERLTQRVKAYGENNG